jgi:hypothetical protein
MMPVDLISVTRSRYIAHRSVGFFRLVEASGDNRVKEVFLVSAHHHGVD